MAETTNRVLSLLNLLQTHRQWAGSELAERLGVTGRTLRRDIERLRELGYRVEATRGAAGGYRLEAGSQLPPLLLTDDEAVTMAIGLRLAATQGLVDGEQTTLSALAKFEQVLPAPLRRRVTAISAVVSRRQPDGALVAHELLGRLALACRDHERIRFSYHAADGAGSRRLVEPHAVVAAESRWFLVCWDVHRADWRTFRLDRMSDLEGTRVIVAERGLPTGDAAEYLRRAVAKLRGAVRVEVLLALPLDEVRAHFGAWAEHASAVDSMHTRWPVSGDSPESVLSALAWIPADVGYTVEASDEVREQLRVSAERMRGALA